MRLRQELRLATVIYGGASLAVYMHGVIKELHKLVRASKLLHNAHYSVDDYVDADSEAVYLEILREISRSSDLRVVIDVVTGASAGAVNGVMLAKALAQDLSLDGQTRLWLEAADIDQLAAGDAGPWSRWYLRPVDRLIPLLLPKQLRGDEETRAKLHRLTRAPWLRAPLSGRRLTGHLLDALASMNASRVWPDSSLIPYGQRLDFYASITDLEGYPRPLWLAEDSEAIEREHGVLCRLSHVETRDAAASSDFREDNDPALAWAARASASYAGAFPAFKDAEMCDVLARREIAWPGRDRFLNTSLLDKDGNPLARLVDPASRYFVDGGIVNNKPFSAAVNALAERPADRHVERCIVYVEPSPAVDVTSSTGLGEKFFATIASAASAIPRHQPIADDLASILEQNEQARLNQRIVEENAEQIGALVERMMADREHRIPTARSLARLRGRAAEWAARELGVAYRAYLQRRLWRLSDALVDGWARLIGIPERDDRRKSMRAAVESIWRVSADWEELDRRSGFLARFDVTYRIRRLHFVIRQINLRYTASGRGAAGREALNEFKRLTYDYVARLEALRHAQSLSDETVAALEELASAPNAPRTAVRRVLVRVAREMALDTFDRDYDTAFARLCRRIAASTETRDAMIADYVGFALFDVLLTTGGSQIEGPDPLTPVRIERISPVDANTLAPAFDGLMGDALMSFAGFFNRTYREHDYLWGRLHAADCLVDVLARTAGEAAGVDFPALRLQLLRAIVDAERPRLARCEAIFEAIDTELAALESAGESPATERTSRAG